MRDGAHHSRRAVLPALALLAAGALACWSAAGDAVGTVLDSITGGPGTTAGTAAAMQPASALIVLPGADSAGWSLFTAGNEYAVAARARASAYRVAPPVQPNMPADPSPPQPPLAELEPSLRLHFLGRPPLVEQIELAAMGSCPTLNDNEFLHALRVVPGTGSLTVTFFSRVSDDIKAVRVGAEPLTLRAPGPAGITWVQLLPATACQEMSQTIKGLRSGDRYRVVIEEDDASPVNGQEHWRMIGRSEGVVVG